MDDAPLELQSNPADTLLETMSSQSTLLPTDIPITEIEIRTTMMVQTKSPPTEPRVLSANPIVREEPFDPPLIGPNILDENREKIVIQTRCKEYVEKQKQKPRSLRTLACFAAPLKSNEESASPNTQPDVTMADAVVAPVDAKAPSTRALWLPEPLPRPLPRKPKKLKAAPPTEPKAMSIDPKSPPTKPRAAPPLMPRTLRPTVSSGRIEKLPRSPPRKVQLPDLPMDAPSVVAIAPYELYSCGCSMPSDCQICTLRRLADKFCAIVTARKELLRLRQNETTAICS